ncbi:alpha/beta hydrolase [Flavobacterium pectinovorum]|uniref:alpha/beta hydrolase n=1 Tax=Flavobacterium pectinovorum TaxID=29533 RepID=UPI001FADCBFE|nr:alpha/beta hydrolase [Flavobacterium pectinovorum]MCI9843542.1 alpha/beta hydrolase [Flavobacterium pectinovorum]
MDNNQLNKTANLTRVKGYSLDTEIAEAMSNFADQHPPGEFPQKGDWQILRETLNGFYANLSQNFPFHPEVSTKDFNIKTSTGNEIKVRWYIPPGKVASGSAIVYVHGGGRVSGSLELYDRIVSHFAYQSDVPFLSVDYHLAPEVQGDAQAEEVFSALTWLKKQAVALEIDEDRIAVMGDSAGGGIAAAVAILARDRKVQLSHQILIYPMLDDRIITPDERLLPFAVWTYDNNYTGWTASLGEDRGKDGVSAIASPARLTEFKGLPPTFISVGDLDIFRNENLEYAGKLAKAGVPIEFHLHQGAPHGFEFIAPDANVSKRAMADYIRIIKSV